MKLWNRLTNYQWDYWKTASAVRILQEIREPPSAKLSQIPRQHSCKVSVTCYQENLSWFLSLPLASFCTLDFLSLLTCHALQTFLWRSFTSFLPFLLFLYILFLHLLRSKLSTISFIKSWFFLQYFLLNFCLLLFLSYLIHLHSLY